MLRNASIACAALLLGGAAVYWFTFAGRTQAPSPLAEGTCRHRLPQSDCAFCTPALVTERGTCAEHGVPEALCWKCNAALVAAFQAEHDWCAAHDCPESLCTICRGPSPSAAAPPTAEEAAVVAALPRSQRPPSATCPNGDTPVRLASPEVVAQAGLGFVELQRRAVTQTVTCNAELAYDGNRFAQLASRAPGVIRAVAVDLGARVGQGDVLATVDSPELAAAKADYLQAVESIALHARNLERESGLARSGISSEREVRELQNKLAEARITQARAAQRLRTFGLDDDDLRLLAESNDPSALLPLTAPFDGEIVQRSAVIGESVDAARTLFGLADTRRMWALLDLPDARVPVRPGQVVELTIEGAAGETFAGQVTWVSTRVDPKTRTLKVRAEFENPDGVLKAHMFGRATILLRDREPLVLVPKSAVQWDGCCNVVFVRADATTFAPRKVKLGGAHDGFLEVRSGVDAGETVVTQGSFLLKTEILKGEIGAGCCPDDFNHRK